MTIWEYCLITSGGDREGCRIVYFRPDGVEEVRHKNFYDAVVEVARDGWEMFAVDHGTRHFKRQIKTD